MPEPFARRARLSPTHRIQNFSTSKEETTMLLHRARVNWLVDFIVTAFMVFFIAFCIVLAVIAGLILAMMFFAAPVFAADAAPSTTDAFSPLFSDLFDL